MKSAKTFVLLHGAWHSSWCWHKVTPALQQLGHEVFTPDLPGHGGDTTPLHKISLNMYSRYILELIDNIENNIYLVGHSMAGMVISQVAELRPEKIISLVYVSGFLPLSGQSLFDLMSLNGAEDDESCPIAQAMEMSKDRRTCAIPRELIGPLFYNRCSPADQQQAITHFGRQATLPLSGKVKLSNENFGSIPRTYITCLNDRVIPPEHQQRMLARQPCSQVLALDSDHSPFLSHPQALVSFLTAPKTVFN